MQANAIAHLEDGDNAVLHLFETDRGVIVLRHQGSEYTHRRGALNCECLLRCARKHCDKRATASLGGLHPPTVSTRTVARTLSK